MQAWLLGLIQEEYAPLLRPQPTVSAECWARVVAAADPVFFFSNDGAPLLHIGEASRERLLAALQREFGGADGALS